MSFDPRYAPPPVYVPESAPRRVRLGALLAGTPGFFLSFGTALFGFGAISAYVLFFGEGRGPTGAMGAAASVFAAIGLGVAAHAVLSSLKRWRLYARGTLAVGRVLSVEPSGTELNGRPVLLTRYAFEGPAGTVEGSSTHMTAPRVGAEVSVLYDPSDPDDSILPLPGAFPRPGGGA